MFSFSKILKYVWPQMRKFRLAFFAIIAIFSLRVVLDSVLRPYYFKKIIDLLSKATTGSHDIIAPQILHIVFIIILLNLSVFVVARIIKFVFFDFEIKVIHELRNFAFQKIEQNSHTFFANNFAGSLVTKVRRFVGSFEAMFDITIYSFLNFTVLIIGVFTVLTRESKMLSLIFFTWICIHILIVSFFIRKKIKYDMLEAEQDSKISGRLADVFSNILAVKFFSARNKEISAFREYTKEGQRRSRQAWYWDGRIDVVQHSLILILQSSVLYTMVNFWIAGTVSAGTVVLVQTYLVILSDKMWDLGNRLTKFMKSASDMQEMIDIFEIVPDIQDPKVPEALKIKEGRIEFRSVGFTYDQGQSVFKDFNLDIAPGEKVGIVGYSGAGKSTITKLLLRFNDVSSGSIYIDGQDIRNITQDDLRSTISFVPQEPVLFHRPIKENIAYGKDDATMDEIISVAKKAHAHEFIENLPMQYDTLVGERGIKLSGGERQRVAIARAMLKDAPILLLDEATSSLDSVSEHFIQDSFNQLMEGKTTIVIAHRLSTIQKMDRIVVLEKGEILEQGSHQELLNKKGRYADLWDHQTGGFLE